MTNLGYTGQIVKTLASYCQAPVGADFIFSILLSLENITSVETISKLVKIVIKKFHKMLTILRMEKICDSIFVNEIYFSTFVSLVCSSCC